MSFYVLTNPVGEAMEGRAVTDAISFDPVLVGEAPRCPECRAFIGPLSWLPPRRVELEVWSSAYGDLAFATGGDLLVSNHFVDLYSCSGLRGLEIHEPVEIAKITRREGAQPPRMPPQYLHSAIGRSRARIDISASGVEHESPPTCEECLGGLIMRWKRVVIEEGTWSGEDIFVARGFPGAILVSERFRDWFVANRINNGVLIPAEEYARDFYPTRNANS
jgi:hypothetical protein